MLFPVLLAAVTVASEEPKPTPIRESALVEAADYCQMMAGVPGKSSFSVPRGAVVYQNFDAATAAILKQRRMLVGPIVDELPDLVVRFAQTQPMARLSTLDPKMFGYVSFAQEDSRAWSISYPKMNACDVMVTGTSEITIRRDALVAFLLNDGWKQTSSAVTSGSPVWRIEMTRTAEVGEQSQRYRATLQGLAEANAALDGVQMEMQFARLSASQ